LGGRHFYLKGDGGEGAIRLVGDEREVWEEGEKKAGTRFGTEKLVGWGWSLFGSVGVGKERDRGLGAE